MRLKAKGLAAFLLVFCMAFTACSAPAVTMQQSSSVASSAPQQNAPFSTIYSIPLSSSQYSLRAFVTADGKEIMRTSNNYLYTLDDEITKQPLAIMEYEVDDEYVEGNDEYYEPSTRVRLFSLDGTLLRDWEDGFYYQAFGRYIWYTNFSPRNMDWSEGPGAGYDDVSELIDMYTGEVKASFLGLLIFYWQNGSPYIIKYGVDMTVQSIMDSNFNLVTDLSASPYERLWFQNGYFLASLPNAGGSHYILDDSLTPIFPDAFMGSSPCGDGFLEATIEKGGKRTEVILDIHNAKSIPSESVLTDKQSLIYFNNNIMFIYDSSIDIYQLYKADGTLLASDFSDFEAPSFYGTDSPPHSYLYLVKDNTLYAVGENGEFAYTCSFPVESIQSVEFPSSNSDNERLIVDLPSSNVTLLSDTLQPILPNAEYADVDVLSCGYIAVKDINTGLYNIFSSTGRLLIKDLDKYYSDYTMTNPGRIIGIKDNTVILMDEGGNWIWHDTYN